MVSRNQNLIYAGIKGTVVALDRATGAQVWKTPLKGGDFINLVIDGDDLFATARGEVFCLDPTNGRIRWNNPMSGFGWGLMTIATAAGSTPAMAEYRKRQQAATAAAAG
jgi:outer membrane protein assembly factor BamB